MKKIILFLAAALIFFVPAASSGDRDDYNSCTPKITLNHREIENAFAGKTGALKEAAILRFYAYYFSCDFSSFRKDVVRVKELVLPLWGNLEKKQFANTYLKDEDSGVVYTVRIAELDKSYLGPKKFKAVIDASNAELRDMTYRNFIIVSDFSDLKPGSYLYAKFDDRLFSVAETIDKRVLPISGTAAGRVSSHYNGNRPPRLLWVDQLKKRTVYPDKGGLSGESFEFRVRYQDDDGQSPKVSQVWIDINGDGKYQKDEKFNMVFEGEEIRDNTFTYGADYFAAVRIAVKKPMAVKFRFYFTDGKDEAENGVPFTDDIPTKEMSIGVGTSVAVNAPKFSSIKFVSGEVLKATLPIFYLYRGVEIDWKSVEENNFKYCL